MAKKEDLQDEVFEFSDQEDQVEYKPKGLVKDVVVDAVGGTGIGKFINRKTITWLVLASVLLLLAMNFRLFLGWSHNSARKAHGAGVQLAQRVKKKSVEPVAAKAEKAKVQMAASQKKQDNKAKALQLVSQVPPALKKPEHTPKTAPVVVAAKQPVKAFPVLERRPAQVAVPPKAPTVPSALPKEKPPLQPEVLLKQVVALDKPSVPKKATAAPLQQEQKALEHSVGTLNKQLVAMRDQQALLEHNLKALVHELKDMQASVGELKKAQKTATKQALAAQKTVETKKDTVKAPVSAKKAVKEPIKAVPHYRVSAMVYGRAWLEEEKTRQVISVSVGDHIPGMKGRVKSIYLEDYFVETTQGERIYDRFE